MTDWQVHEDFRRIRPQLEGRHVRLRAIEEEDLPRLGEMLDDPSVLYFLDAVAFPQGEGGTRAWWESIRESRSELHLTVETLAGEVAGACGLRELNPRVRSAALGLWIGVPFWDRGLGTDTVRTLCRFAFRELNLQRVELRVHETNPRGRRAYEKAGFVEEGRLRRAHFVDGRHVDVVVMGLLVEELVEDV